jgi:glycine/D-amino acid oxidase-like deaminating enzyme
MRILIAGAGLFGAASALALQQRGAQVHLFDPGPLPHPQASSTDISKAVRMDYGADLYYTEMMKAALGGWERWNKEWEKPPYHQSGVQILAREAMQAAGFEYESYHLLKKHQIPLERLDEETIVERFPAWQQGFFRDGYFNPRAGWVESGRVVETLIQQAAAAGVQVHAGESVRTWLWDGVKVSGLETHPGGRFLGDFVVLAAGAWTPALHPGLKQLMWPTAQDLFHFRVPDPTIFQPPRFSVWTGDIARTGWYGFPAKDDGTLKIANHGAGRRIQPGGNIRVAAASLPRFRRFLRQALPAIAEAECIQSRVCFYADTFDGDFWIDHDPVRPGLLVASGGSGHAFKFAPLLGEIVADVLERKDNPYAARFAWRELGEQKTEDARYEGAPL